MKKDKKQSKGAPKVKTPDTDALHKKLVAAEKSVETARAAYEQKSAAYEAGLKQHADKITLLGLLASAKIAKLNIKIKRLEYKLAKATWKAAVKTDKKAAEKREAAHLQAISKKLLKKAEKAAADTKPVKKKRVAME